uniref:Prevent-host-death family protein n=1 Tax=Candidatus Kentrum sp. MB TaxID=2138164 RepID=A0A450X2V8_9GAMM|nr:MAG: prevent-host-death family protein [Candidatus Kentron sp. MB]VFK27982.1 MAG: prevent-host-death family protein [Candidatus Kentron sp. MB]
MKLHPQLIQKQGKNEFVVLSIEEYESLTRLVEDYEDLKDLREEKNRSQEQKPVPLKTVVKELGL